ncbi:MAG: T9SS type A sorting domain-containing protein [Ignavibacteriales bacterium]|nr:T9SS type A sorting domain-containing protein [Ignavibacteriales bacterium]
MRKQFLFTLTLLLLPFLFLKAQVFDGEWSCLYATEDDRGNGTGHNTISVASLGEDEFVALVNVNTNVGCYLVGYRGADSLLGRLNYYGYGSSEVGAVQLEWISGFDLVQMNEAYDIASGFDSLIFVANNDDNHNILVFKLGVDSVYSHPWRLEVGTTDSLWAIDLDDNGRVFISTQGDDSNPSKVIVYDSPTNDASWESGHTTTPLHTITLPDNGVARGVTVNADGTIFYVSNFDSKKIYRYDGNPTDGYTLNTIFNCEIADTHIATLLGSDTLYPGPWGLQFLNGKNLLFVACDVSFQTGSGYEYGRIYTIEPNTGAVLDTIDAALWNYIHCDSSYYRPGSADPGNASGYTSTYNLDFDENENIYTQSFFGWTIDKWQYSSTLPTIPILGIERDPVQTPVEFSLNQNYPNPFNPTTTVEFSIVKDGDVTLSVYSINGELIQNLINSTYFSPGTYKVTFDASKLVSGTYIYTLRFGNEALSKKMMLIK